MINLTIQELIAQGYLIADSALGHYNDLHKRWSTADDYINYYPSPEYVIHICHNIGTPDAINFDVSYFQFGRYSEDSEFFWDVSYVVDYISSYKLSFIHEPLSLTIYKSIEDDQ